MSIGDIKVFTISQNGFVLSVQAVDVGGGQTEFVITSLQGKGDLNAIWWTDGDSTVDGNVTLSKSDNSLNMNGTGVVWDGYCMLSSSGLGKDGENKSTFISQGETLTYTAKVSLADISGLGIRATSVNGGDSIKGVDTGADHTYTMPSVSIGDASVEEGGKAQFTVSLSNAYAYDIKVYYGTSDGSATSGSDYTGASGYVIIPAGQTTATVSVQTIDDYYKEGNETFNVTLNSATTNVLGSDMNVGISDGTGVGTIVDDKDTTTVSLSAPASVDEGGTITVTATVDHAPQGDLVIELSNGETITILDGQTTGHVDFAAPADDVYNDASTLDLSIKSATGGNYEELDASDTATVTITDNDSPPSFSIDDVTVNEADGTITFTVTKAGATALDATVDYTVAPGTALAGSDYTAGPDPLSDTLTFAAGETTKTITLTIVDDAVFEQTEQFYVNLSNPTNATISDSQGVGTIIDNDLNDLGGPTGIDFMPGQSGNNPVLGRFIQLGNPDAVDHFTFSYTATSNNALPASNVSVDAAGNLSASQSNAGIGDYNVHVTVTDQANHSTSADFHLLVGVNGNSADTLTGGSGSDILAGFNGDDTLTGGEGRDYLLGSQQNDLLSGGGGDDMLFGGGGNDQFRMIAPAQNGTDVILDFTDGSNTIGLLQGGGGWNAANTSATANGATLNASDYQNRAAITNIALGDNNKVVEIQSAQTTSHILGDTGAAANAYVAVFNSDTGKGEIWYDSDWSDAGGRVQIATLDDVTNLSQLLGLDNTKFVEWS